MRPVRVTVHRVMPTILRAGKCTAIGIPFTITLPLPSSFKGSTCGDLVDFVLSYRPSSSGPCWHDWVGNFTTEFLTHKYLPIKHWAVVPDDPSEAPAAAMGRDAPLHPRMRLLYAIRDASMMMVDVHWRECGDDDSMWGWWSWMWG